MIYIREAVPKMKGEGKMKTKLLRVFAAALMLAMVSTCVAFGYNTADVKFTDSQVHYTSSVGYAANAQTYGKVDGGYAGMNISLFKNSSRVTTKFIDAGTYGWTSVAYGTATYYGSGQKSGSMDFGQGTIRLSYN